MNEDAMALDPVEMAVEVTSAWLSNPSTRVDAADVAAFLTSVHAAIAGLVPQSGKSRADVPSDDSQTRYEPATTVRKSLASDDHIISMIDGKPYKTLRRHLAGHGLTAEQYRERYGLKPDYPMVAKAYSEIRSQMAKDIGLGRKAKAD